MNQKDEHELSIVASNTCVVGLQRGKRQLDTTVE